MRGSGVGSTAHVASETASRQLSCAQRFGRMHEGPGIAARPFANPILANRASPPGVYWQTGSPSAPELTAEPTAIEQVFAVEACVAWADQPVASPLNVSDTPDEPVGAV